MNNKILKNINKAFSLGLVACSLVACANQYKKSIEYLYMTSETIELLDEFEPYLIDGSKKFLTEEGWEASYNSLISRQGQKPVTTETTHPLTCETFMDESVYYMQSSEDYDSIVLYVHGGAYVFEISYLHVQFCDDLLSKMNAKACIPLYPLAPEHTFEECYAFMDALYDQLLKENKPIYIMGDSAGGGYTLAFTEYLKATGKTLPNKLVVLSPWVDVTMSNEDIRVYEYSDISLASYGAIEAGKLWAGETDRTDYRISPIYGDLDHLPDTLMFVGTHEIIYPDDMKFYEKVTNTNIQVVIGEGFWHVFPIYPIAEKATCIDKIVDFVK